MIASDQSPGAAPVLDHPRAAAGVQVEGSTRIAKGDLHDRLSRQRARKMYARQHEPARDLLATCSN
jgi:hypothetical protein